MGTEPSRNTSGIGMHPLSTRNVSGMLVCIRYESGMYVICVRRHASSCQIRDARIRGATPESVPPWRRDADAAAAAPWRQWKAGTHNNWSAAAAIGAAPGRRPPAAPSSQFPATARRWRRAAPVAPCQLLPAETWACLSKISGRSHPHPRAVASRGRRLARAGPASACPRPLRVEARGVPRAGGRPVPDSLARVEGRASPGTNSTRAWPGRGGIGNRD